MEMVNRVLRLVPSGGRRRVNATNLRVLIEPFTGRP